MGLQRSARAAAVTPYRTSQDKGHLSSVNLPTWSCCTFQQLMPTWGTRGQKVKYQPWQQTLFQIRLTLMGSLVGMS